MRKTFKQLLKQYPTFTNEGGYGKEYVLEMLKFVREKTIEECIKNAKVHNRQLNPNSLAFNKFWELDKNSLLNLDKESIEI